MLIHSSGVLHERISILLLLSHYCPAPVDSDRGLHYPRLHVCVNDSFHRRLSDH